MHNNFVHNKIVHNKSVHKKIVHNKAVHNNSMSKLGIPAPSLLYILHGIGYGQRGRSRGRGWQPRADGACQHNAGYSYNERYDIRGTGSFLTQIEREKDGMCDAIVYACHRDKIDWILDSGCTDHIVNDDSYFSECVNLN